ncbi:MAG: aldo/keto reductase [Nitrospira sp.]|nr:aldo/keto reductase [Nitrospira sp.]
MTLTAYNHISIPFFMYGTAWKKEATPSLVLQAVEAGFRAIDTANQLVHYDEARVGDALEQLAQRGIARSQLFLQTKFTPLHGHDHRLPYDPRASLAEQVRQSFAGSLDHLRTDYLDSYVLHGPYFRRGLGEEDWEVWAAIESLYVAGKTKMIGVSNVSAEQLTLFCERAKHKPMVVQNRCYAALGWDKDVREICRRHGIIYQGFSLLTANRAVLIDHRIRAMTARYRATPAQLVFRFAMQVGMLPITGTTNPEHMKEDLLSDRFTLSVEDVKQIESISDS